MIHAILYSDLVAGVYYTSPLGVTSNSTIMSRICPGKDLGDASLFVAFSMVLAVFNISKAQDSTGKIIEPEVEYLPGVVR